MPRPSDRAASDESLPSGPAAFDESPPSDPAAFDESPPPSPVDFVEPTTGEWTAVIAAEVRSDPTQALWWTLPEGIPLRAFYTSQDLADRPFTVRGRAPGAPWGLREELRPGDAPSGEDTLVALRAEGDPDAVAAFLDRSPRCESVHLLAGTRGFDLLRSLPSDLAARVAAVESDPAREAAPGRVLRSRAEALGAPGRSLTVDGSGLAPALGLPWTLCGASEWLAFGTRSGIAPSNIFGRMLLKFDTSMSYFPTIARLRALRIGLERLSEAWGGRAQDAALARIHARVPAGTFARERPETNLARAAVQLSAAVFGDADAVEIPPFDAGAGGSARGRRLARNVHLVAREEAMLHRIADPVAGSWYVETATARIGEAAWSVLQRVEAAGGLDRRLAETGDPHAVIAGGVTGP